MNNLLCNVHEGLDAPGETTELVKSDILYYHYLCDGVDDRGWGCGYRTLQSICSWVKREQELLAKSAFRDVPTLREIQEALVAMEDKPSSFIGSREWIGSFEICLCLDYFYETPCKIIHVSSGSNLKDHIPDLVKHFKEFGSPVMMGGDTDNASKGVLGVCLEPAALLIMDPHFYDKNGTKDQLQRDGFVTWRTLDTFVRGSFYNFCLPQLKHKQLQQK